MIQRGLALVVFSRQYLPCATPNHYHATIPCMIARTWPNPEAHWANRTIGGRKAAATRAAENGATARELEAIFGWSGGRTATLCTKSANRRRLAAGAIGKLDRTETENRTSIPAPSAEVRAGSRNTK
jgi:hypothetical protein